FGLHLLNLQIGEVPRVVVRGQFRSGRHCLSEEYDAQSCDWPGGNLRSRNMKKSRAGDGTFNNIGCQDLVEGGIGNRGNPGQNTCHMGGVLSPVSSKIVLRKSCV